MDEESLTSAIEQYKQQFLQVQTVLQSAGEEGQEDLVKLRDDLVELIHITEESLLSLKKSKLLQFLDDQKASVSQEINKSSERQCAEEINTGDNDDDDVDGDDDDDITGTKCRVAFTQDWGMTEHHNAMVFRVETVPSDDDAADQAKVRVLFLNPTHNSMVPCPFFLDGKCRFTEQECRYSHGFLVNVDELKPFKDPDFSAVHTGQQCLARYSDGVWYKSTIKSIDEDNHEFLVHYDTYNADATLPLDDVYPLRPRETESDSESDDQSALSDSEESKVINGGVDDVIRYAWRPTGGRVSLGDWEQHTRGIGSKLMTQMGYIFGKGLGKDGSGRVEPIEVVVLPPGKSLDKCVELREKNKLKEPFKRKKNKATTANGLSAQAKPSNVFDFINHRLGHNKVNLQDIREALPGSKADDPDIRKTRKSQHDDTNTNWNVELFKIHEEIAAAKKQLRKQEAAVKRQAGGDSKNNAFFKGKRDHVQTQLQQLQAQEKLIQQKLRQRDQHKKLTVF